MLSQLIARELVEIAKDGELFNNDGKQVTISDLLDLVLLDRENEIDIENLQTTKHYGYITQFSYKYNRYYGKRYDMDKIRSYLCDEVVRVAFNVPFIEDVEGEE